MKKGKLIKFIFVLACLNFVITIYLESKCINLLNDSMRSIDLHLGNIATLSRNLKNGEKDMAMLRDTYQNLYAEYLVLDSNLKTVNSLTWFGGSKYEVLYKTDIDKLEQMLHEYTYDADQFQIEIERFCDVVNKDYDVFHLLYKEYESNIDGWLKIRFFGLE